MPLGALGLVAACTLTNDSFEPDFVSRVGGELSPGETNELPAPVGDGEEGAALGGSSPEQSGGGVPLDPGALGVDRPGVGSSSGTSNGGPGDAGGTDQGTASPGPEGEGSAGPDAGASPLSPSSCSDSEAGGNEFGGSCYQLFGELAPWGVAEQRCIAWGGHLASVESSEEDDFIAGWPALLGIPAADGSGVWLGGTDAALDGDFRWLESGEFPFESWAPSQPDNGAGVDCIEKRNDGTALWYDRRCTDALAFVCERPL